MVKIALTAGDHPASDIVALNAGLPYTLQVALTRFKMVLRLPGT